MKTLYAEILMTKEELERIGSAYPIKLEYYKVANNLEDCDTRYGIEVIKRVKINKVIDIEAKHIKDVSNNERQTDMVLEKLINYRVTPRALEDVTEDLIKQYQIAQ